jgi:hypothetical protein
MKQKADFSGLQWLTSVNPSYSGDKDQENHTSKPAQGIACKTLPGKTQYKTGLVK